MIRRQQFHLGGSGVRSYGGESGYRRSKELSRNVRWPDQIEAGESGVDRRPDLLALPCWRRRSLTLCPESMPSLHVSPTRIMCLASFMCITKCRPSMSTRTAMCTTTPARIRMRVRKGTMARLRWRRTPVRPKESPAFLRRQCCGLMCVTALPATVVEIVKPSAPTALCEVEGYRKVTDNAPARLYRPPIS